ncbi:MAG TPA: hypothetical protein VGH90_09820 [Chthoniobacteraceae bacterium]|jgi:predicted SAM-dependent methyltransferase
MSKKWHFGCGNREFPGWLNTDCELDLEGPLGFGAGELSVALGQHVIEHFSLSSGMQLCRAIHSALCPGGVLYLATPDMEKICRHYVEGTIDVLIQDRQKRIPHWVLELHAPPSHFVNDLFHQRGEHKLLYDWPLMEWMLREAGFSEIRRIDERTLVEEQHVPWRHDDAQALYVKAIK